MAEIRTLRQRQADALAKLEKDADVWVATAHDSRSHLVPLSLCWDGTEVILAVEGSSRTALNVIAGGTVRLALGDLRDVVMVDATARVVPCPEASDDLTATYLARTGWNPAESAEDFVFLCLRPVRIQVWNSLPEIAGRTVMKNGEWLAPE